MHHFQEHCQIHGGWHLVRIKDKCIINNIVRFGFCDIRNNQGFGRCYQPQPSIPAHNTCLNHDYSRHPKMFSLHIEEIQYQAASDVNKENDHLGDIVLMNNQILTLALMLM